MVAGRHRRGMPRRADPPAAPFARCVRCALPFRCEVDATIDTRALAVNRRQFAAVVGDQGYDQNPQYFALRQCTAWVWVALEADGNAGWGSLTQLLPP